MQSQMFFHINLAINVAIFLMHTQSPVSGYATGHNAVNTLGLIHSYSYILEIFPSLDIIGEV